MKRKSHILDTIEKCGSCSEPYNIEENIDCPCCGSSLLVIDRVSLIERVR